jgi:catechol 2,3-dioxygenase
MKPDPKERPSPALDPAVRIGHVHLKVADLDRALAFYCGVLGFELTQRYGPDAAFVSAGGYHHHIGLNTWESRGGSPPPPGATGLYHFAILYPTRATLADALRRLQAAGVPLDGASDHGVSEALYLHDPDANGIELYLGPPGAGVAAGCGGRPGNDDAPAGPGGPAPGGAVRPGSRTRRRLPVTAIRGVRRSNSCAA